MFKNVITSTPLTSQEANDLFEGRIYGSGYAGDCSFVATLRALMDPRLPEGKRIYLYSGSSTIGASSAQSASKRDLVNNILYSYFLEGETDSIYIHNMAGSEEGNRICMDAVSEEFVKVYEGFHCLPDVTNLYRKTFEVLCFVNPETKQTVLFVNSLNFRKYHYLQCSILGILPWYFNPEQGITELESELIYSLREKTSEKYEAAIAKFAERYDFNKSRIKKLLSGFETRFERREIEKELKTIERANTEINNYNSRIAEQLRLVNEHNIRLLGLQAKVGSSSGESEIMDYFLCNRRLYLETVNSDNTMVFDVKDYLTYYDEEMVKSCLSNNHSYVYTYCHENDNSVPITKSQMKKLITAIFLDQKIRMRFCSSYAFQIGTEVKGLDAHQYPDEFATYMPNPHIDRYSCMGSYSTTINTLLQNNDYIGALEQCIASCKSLNWADGSVMNVFFRRITDNRTSKIYELPDGEIVNIMEAIEWIENLEKSDEETEEK